MSGLEIVGVVLATFTVIISSLEHWRDVAKVNDFWWNIRKEYAKCRSDVIYHEIVYKRNIKELLLPLATDVEIGILLKDPGGTGWSHPTLQTLLENRLEESYQVFKDIMLRMNTTTTILQKELCFDGASVQEALVSVNDNKLQQTPSRLSSKSTLIKGKISYQKFRVKFSLGESARNELFAQLEEGNSRLQTLLSTGNRLSALQSHQRIDKKPTIAYEQILQTIWRSSDVLFKALQKAWHCQCQDYHFAHLRLEHRTTAAICFELILMVIAPAQSNINIPWSWQELECGQMQACPHSRVTASVSVTPTANSNMAATSRVNRATEKSGKGKKVSFSPAQNTPLADLAAAPSSSVRLCRQLMDADHTDCLRIIGEDDLTYHLHPFSKRARVDVASTLTLDHILSKDSNESVSRRERYEVALLIASSFAQVKNTSWLRAELTKKDIIFFRNSNDETIKFQEPFICQGFAKRTTQKVAIEPGSRNFKSLGIILLELCFGQRLEDHPFRNRYPVGDANLKSDFDIMAALNWSKDVCGEAGEDYATAVNWCFGSQDSNTNWRKEIIEHIIQPLEQCLAHFKKANMVTL
ncbi:hypothetical protein GQ44DRAFT_699698 [Phaeosphaeriaceae sp. PMI808]|nr:hypothetical protein GQ44DRAFT_699698 [Phaeosphaeriaceae sp. PMI808]